MKQDQLVHVAVGVITNDQEEVLVALRPLDAHQGGLWEFPGGKVERLESVQEALSRELEEELGIRILESAPFIQVRHDYADKSVLLDIWNIGSFSGSPSGREGQEIQWRKIMGLKAADFPLANAQIIRALQSAVKD